MAFVLIVAGSILLVAAVRNTQQTLFMLVQRDFSGPNNFIYWLVSIFIIGALGYIPKVKPASDGLLILLIAVLFLKRGSGFFDMFQKQISATNQAPITSTEQSIAAGLNNSLPPIGTTIPTLPTIPTGIKVPAR